MAANEGTREEIESMLLWWRKRLSNSERPKHKKLAAERIAELEKKVAEASR